MKKNMPSSLSSVSSRTEDDEQHQKQEQQQQQQMTAHHEDDDDNSQQLDDDDDMTTNYEASSSSSSIVSDVFWTTCKLMTSVALIYSAVSMVMATTSSTTLGGAPVSILGSVLPLSTTTTTSTMTLDHDTASTTTHHRRLSTVDEESSGGSISSTPSYMTSLFNDLLSRQKLFDDTPPEEIKYWFEYAGPLQKYFYRFSKSRGKADYFEGRDDSGVVSERFMNTAGGNSEFREVYLEQTHGPDATIVYKRLFDQCVIMGAPTRPDTSSGTWAEWFGKKKNPAMDSSYDRCRVLFAINTVGAGRGTTMLWETNPPLIHGELPPPFTSEQETAVTHLQRNLEEINSLCESGLFAVKIQMFVCEPIPSIWIEWLDSQVPDCGGRPFTYDMAASSTGSESTENTVKVEDRPSPIQVVVSASATTADRCHDLKSGFMERRVQDVLIAPPLRKENEPVITDPSMKITHPDLFSSSDHDMYVGLKWSSLVTIRAVHSFIQASADLVAASSSASTTPNAAVDPTMKLPASPFLIPSFVRVSYVSEENPKVAKWRMHGDFFHPAAWEISKDSFEMTFLPQSLAISDRSRNTIQSMCDVPNSSGSVTERKLLKENNCGQWWVYFTELQMPTSPEVYANEISPPPVQGGSNFVWMLTDRQRRELVKSLLCLHEARLLHIREGSTETDDVDDSHCPAFPQAVIPLGDLESFLINYTPNTALGREHVVGRRPGYSNEEQREKEREAVKQRKQLNGQDEIESALFDYTIYPAALFHKDATIKAARGRDVAKAKEVGAEGHHHHDKAIAGPRYIKSSYYDVTITKPRPPLLGWCQAIARNGLCTLYADYFRRGYDTRCAEACGYVKQFTPI